MAKKHSRACSNITLDTLRHYIVRSSIYEEFTEICNKDCKVIKAKENLVKLSRTENNREAQ